jgi:hypothetical protein
MNRLYFSVKKPFVHVLAFVAWVERSVCSIQKFTKFWVNEFEMRPLSPIEKKLNFFFLRFFTCDSGMYIQMKTADRTGHTSGSIGATCTYVHMCRAAEICLKNYFTFGKVGLGFKCTEVQKFADRKTRNLYFLNNKWHPERFFRFREIFSFISFRIGGWKGVESWFPQQLKKREKNRKSYCKSFARYNMYVEA